MSGSSERSDFWKDVLYLLNPEDKQAAETILCRLLDAILLAAHDYRLDLPDFINKLCIERRRQR